METTELRIGNLVDWETSETTGEPQILTIARIVACSEDGEIIVEFDDIKSDNPYGYQDCNADDLRPILLTEKLIFKLGFAVYSIKKSYTIFCRFGDPDNRINATKTGFYYKVYNGTIKIEYVHQLQNLYFALTGKELEFLK